MIRTFHHIKADFLYHGGMYLRIPGIAVGTAKTRRGGWHSNGPGRRPGDKQARRVYQLCGFAMEELCKAVGRLDQGHARKYI